ncbi:hypothetical protein ILYODFUR_009462 [Ilyodon furcidens]|uniref:Uncharacterized protein n=1 Tax=Ilyodon furcidens TaxID=33524 RepID=A0ABV0SYM4_9TELE
MFLLKQTGGEKSLKREQKRVKGIPALLEDAQQQTVIKEEVSWNTNLDQHGAEVVQIKQEKEELWISQEEKQDRVTGVADSVETSRLPSPQTPPPVPPGGAQGNPRPAERHSPSSVSWAVPWASSWWDMPGTPPEEGVQEASDIDARATSNGSS